LWKKGVSEIDTVILTHTHFNHYQGLTAVVRNFKINNFITTGETSDEPEYLELLKIIAERKIPIRRISAGETIETDGVKTDVLWPDKLKDNTDDNSMALKLTYGGFSALLCGDISRIIQNRLTEKDIMADILMVPGHGKKKLLLDFLNQVEPDCAIMSTDMPSEAVTEQLGWYKTMSTAEAGTITVESDGKNYKLSKTRQAAPMEMIVQEFN
jgi:competence protein ComEC